MFLHFRHPSSEVLRQRQSHEGQQPQTRITMIAFVTRIAVVTLSLGQQVGLAVADGPPKLNVAPSCDGATRSSINIGRDNEACMGDERDARNLLTKNWSQYSRAHKTQCVDMARGGPSSYIELISCLDS